MRIINTYSLDDVKYFEDSDCKIVDTVDNGVKHYEIYFKNMLVTKVCEKSKKYNRFAFVKYYARRRFKYELILISSNEEKDREIMIDRDKLIDFCDGFVDEYRAEEINQKINCVAKFKTLEDYERWVQYPYFIGNGEKNITLENLVSYFYPDCKELAYIIQKGEENCKYNVKYFLKEDSIYYEGDDFMGDTDFSKWSVYNWRNLFINIKNLEKFQPEQVGNIVKIISMETSYDENKIYLLQKIWEELIDNGGNKEVPLS